MFCVVVLRLYVKHFQQVISMDNHLITMQYSVWILTIAFETAVGETIFICQVFVASYIWA